MTGANVDYGDLPLSGSDRLEDERRYVAETYARLDELREEKREQLARVRRDQSADSPQNRSERDAFAALYEKRLAQLESVDHQLVFGRLDLDDHETRYIGRLGLFTADLQKLLVDWRAPEARTFYQATAAQRLGVLRRRHMLLQGRELKSVEDEVFDPSWPDEAHTLQGEGALMAALYAKRTGHMKDIVSTIQAEQDRIIRSSLAGVVVVQGGPGTGKTAVALHRAAYLLYTYRERLGPAGVLVVGPSASFLTYIERILPSLGETGVVMTRLGTLIPGYAANRRADAETSFLKGQLVMAKILRRAVSNRQRVLAQDRVLLVRGYSLTLRREQVVRAREKARATQKPHNEARQTFLKILLRELTDELVGLVQTAFPGQATDERLLGEDVRSARSVRIALNLCWMPLTPEQMLNDLFGNVTVLREMAPELSEAECAKLVRPPGTGWSEADLPLLDEAAELLGSNENTGKHETVEYRRDLENAEQALRNMNQTLAEAGVDGMLQAEDVALYNRHVADKPDAVQRAMTERDWTFHHIIVDEAQELSPMQWRVLTRRCPRKSFTIVGDIAQGVAVTGASSWNAVLAPHFGQRWKLEELTVNYRTPEQISTAAARMMQSAGQSVTIPQAVRQGQWPPIVAWLPENELTRGTLAALEEEISHVEGGMVTVIAPESRIEIIQRAIAAQYAPDPEETRVFARGLIALRTPAEAKGLESDGVLLVDPGRMLDTTPDGALHAGNLYVAMTRATQRLRMLLVEALPSQLDLGQKAYTPPREEHVTEPEKKQKEK